MKSKYSNLDNARDEFGQCTRNLQFFRQLDGQSLRSEWSTQQAASNLVD